MACEDAETISDAILAAAAVPKSVTTDGMTVDQHSLADLIAAQKHLAAGCASTSPRRGLRITKLIPPPID